MIRFTKGGIRSIDAQFFCADYSIFKKARDH